MAIKFFAFFFPTISTFGCFWSQWPTSLAVTSGREGVRTTMWCGRLPSRSDVNILQVQDTSLHRILRIVFHTQNLLHTDAFAQKLLHTGVFTYRHFYTQALLHTEFLHTETFTHRRFYTQTLDTFTHRRFYAQTPLHTDIFTHRHFYTQMHLHTDIFTRRSVYTHFTRRSVYTQTRLHTEVFTFCF